MDVTVSVQDGGPVSRNINITIPRQLFKDRYNAIVRKTASQAQIKGFRPGKAPSSVVTKLYGPRIHADVLSEFIEKACRDAVRDNELKVVGSFSIQEMKVDEPDDLEVKAEVALLPEPKIKDYSGLELEVHLHEVNEEVVEQEVTKIREAFSDKKPVGGRTTTQTDDVVCVDYEAFIDGTKPNDGERKDEYIQLNPERLQAEIAQALTGAEVGDVREVVLGSDDGEEAGEEGAGAKKDKSEYRYVFTVKGIFEKVLPDLDDELAKKSGMGESVAELKSKLRERFEKEAEKHNRAAREGSLLDAVLAKNEFEVPQVMVDEQIRGMLQQMGYLRGNENEVAQADMTPFREPFGEAATKQIKRSIALEQIIKQEKVEVTDDDLKIWAGKRARDFGSDLEKLMKMINGRPEDKKYFSEIVARTMMVDKLLAQTTFKECHDCEAHDHGDKKATKKPATKKSKKK